MNLIGKITVLFLVFCFSFQTRSQENQPLKIGLKDQHTTSLSSVLLHPSGDYLITGDLSGKVLMYATADFGFKKKIAPATGIPINQLLLTNDGNLLVNKRLARDYNLPPQMGTVTDSLLKFNPETLEKELVLGQSLQLVEIPPSRGSVFLGAHPEDPYSDVLYYIHPSDKSQSFSLEPGKKIRSAALSGDGQVVLLGNSFGYDYLEVHQIGGEVLLSEKMPLQYHLKQVHFSVEDNGFYILAFNAESNELQLLFLDKNLERTTVDTQSFPYVLDVVSTHSDTEYSSFVITGSGPGTTAFFYKRGNDGYKVEKLELETPASLGIYLPGKQEFVFWKDFDPHYDNMLNFTVYNETPFQALASYPKTSEGQYSALFLPGNNWMAVGSDNNIDLEGGFNTNLKYFETGTFNNRFGKLSFEEYLLLNFGVEKNKATRFFLEPVSGAIAFSALQKRNDDFAQFYYIYDLQKNKIEEFRGAITDFNEVVGYNAAQELFLVSTGRIFDYGYEEPRPLKVVGKNSEIDLKGTFRYALFSNNGKYLLTVSTQNLVEVFDISTQTVITRDTLGPGNFHLFAFEDDNFVLSWASSSYSEECGKKTLTFGKDESGAYLATSQDCLFLTDFDYKSGLMALLIEDNMVMVNNQALKTPGEKPTSLSLNPEASRLMVNFTSGKTGIYDPKTLELLGTMYHPDRNSHLFVDAQNRYFSNIDPQEYLYAQQGGASVPLSQATEYYDPVALLKLFGTPDPAYVTALQKAEEIREEALKPLSANNQGFRITQVLFDGDAQKSSTTNRNVQALVEIQNNDGPVQELLVRLNGVVLQELKLKKEKKGLFAFDLSLVDRENTIEITAITADDKTSLAFEKKLVYTGEIPKPDLYVLSIGVSDYRESDWNLTFADKDAMDIARFYGNFNGAEQKFYEDKFLGEAFQLLSNDEGTRGRINRYTGSYAAQTFLSPLNTQGTHWIEESSDGSFKLWDYTKGTISDLNLPQGFDLRIWGNSEIFPKPEGDGFYFRMESEYYEYSFAESTFQLVALPFVKKLQGTEPLLIRPLENGKWMAFETENLWNSTSGDLVNIHFAEPRGASWATSQLSFELPDNSHPRLKGVSPQGNRFLFYLFGTDSLVVATAGKERVNLETISIKGADALEMYQFSPDGSSFSELLVEYPEGQPTRNTYLKYDLQGKVLDSVVLAKEKLRGISYSGGSLKWIEQEPPMVDINQYLYDSEEQIMAASPASFGNTYVEFLVDTDATAVAISEKLKNFLSRARPQDQIMVFFAGHGILDKDHNYYYAPHDMEFEQVKERGISFESILEGMTASPALKKLLLMDTCHSGNTFDLASGEEREKGDRQEGQRGSVATKTGGEKIKVSEIIAGLFDNFRSTNGITILSASSGEDVAYETKELGNGAFTTALLNSLRQQLGGDLGLVNEQRLAQPVPLTNDLINQIQIEVMSLTKMKQVPDIREVNELAKIRIW